MRQGLMRHGYPVYLVVNWNVVLPCWLCATVWLEKASRGLSCTTTCSCVLLGCLHQCQAALSAEAWWVRNHARFMCSSAA